MKRLLALVLAVTSLATTSCLSPGLAPVIVSLADIGLRAAVEHGKLAAGDALTISHGVAIVTDGESGVKKAVKLGALGLQAAVDKGVVSPGDGVLIQEGVAVITKAIIPAEVSPLVDGLSGK